MVERKKWILYKHTNNFEMIKAVALDVKNKCKTDISDTERYRMQERLKNLDLYNTRNPKNRPLDSINHRINTLEYYMFGYEEKETKRFMFSPLGNLFLKNINNKEQIDKIFSSMLFAIQFPHPRGGTDHSFQLYPFRLLFKLLLDKRLEYKIFNPEYTIIIAMIENIDEESYEKTIQKILESRNMTLKQKEDILKTDEHTHVNSIYEWEYYTQKLLEDTGIIKKYKGEKICKLYHPSKRNSKSPPTGRIATNGYITLNENLKGFISKMLDKYNCFEKPLPLDDPNQLMIETIKEIYSFYPEILLKEINEYDEITLKLLELPKLVEEYSRNPNNETAYLFEWVLCEGFNLFYNVEAKKIGGAGHTDIECLYIPHKRKFAVESKSTSNKLIGVNAGRIREHRNEIGGKYTIVITPRYVPAVKKDIWGTEIVIILASTFSEYLYNHIYNGIREIDYEDFDNIIMNNMGKDISKLISDKTIEKFASYN